MIQIICGQKGKGKTKFLLDRANTAIKEAKGSIVFLDKSDQHIYELNNRIRLINVTNYHVYNYDSFIGFVCGILSQDHDLEQIYIDAFLRLADLTGKDITEAIKVLDDISDKFHTTFILSVSMNENELPEAVRDKISISL